MNLTATTFDRSNAAQCVAACAAAYDGRPTISDAKTDTNVLVQDCGNAVIVAFRGSKSLKNWITDAEFLRKLLVDGECGRAEVHAGFLDAFESIIGELTEYLRQPGFGRPLFITGHSLGGALAILAALELQRQGFPVQQVYTFGQPRVGNGAFKKLYDAALGPKTFRVVYEEDIVPRIPHLPSLTDPYRHVANEIFIQYWGELVLNPDTWLLLASDGIGLWRAWRAGSAPGLLDDALADHHIGNYTKTFPL